MEVEANTAQVEALMNLIRSTYPQIVQELSQLSNSVSDGEPPWKKQRIDRTYANNDNRGQSKNVLGDVYKYSVVNNINLAFNFTLTNAMDGDPRIKGFDIAKLETRGSTPWSMHEEVDRNHLENAALSQSRPESSQDILVNGTAPAELVTDPHLLQKGFQAQSRLVEVHRKLENPAPHPMYKRRKRQKLFALLGMSRRILHGSNQLGRYVDEDAGFQIQNKGFFTPGAVFDAQYGVPEYDCDSQGFHFALQIPFKFLVVQQGLYCCSVVPVIAKEATSEQFAYHYNNDYREIGVFCRHEDRERPLRPPYFDRRLRVVDVDEANWRPEAYEFNYRTVFTIDVTIRARALGRVAEHSLSDLDAQFKACWNHESRACGLQRRNSALD